jgi:hypothetical protein
MKIEGRSKLIQMVATVRNGDGDSKMDRKVKA